MPRMKELQQTIRVITTNVPGFHSGSNEISHAATDLSRRMEQQAASLEETAATLDEITATVRQDGGKRAARRHRSSPAPNLMRNNRTMLVRQAVQAMDGIE